MRGSTAAASASSESRTFTPASFSWKAISPGASSGEMPVPTAPRRDSAATATRYCGTFGRCSPTTSPFATPSARNAVASLRLCVNSSPYPIPRSWNWIATASGLRPAWSARCPASGRSSKAGAGSSPSERCRASQGAGRNMRRVSFLLCGSSGRLSSRHEPDNLLKMTAPSSGAFRSGASQRETDPVWCRHACFRPRMVPVSRVATRTG